MSRGLCEVVHDWLVWDDFWERATPTMIRAATAKQAARRYFHDDCGEWEDVRVLVHSPLDGAVRAYRYNHHDDSSTLRIVRVRTYVSRLGPPPCRGERHLFELSGARKDGGTP